MRRIAIAWMVGVMVLMCGMETGCAEELAAGIRVQRNIVYATGAAGALMLDVYLPAGAKAPMPVIVRIAPKREQASRPANELLAKGYALIYAGYLPDAAPRIAAFNPFPADVQAAKAVIRWMRGHAAERGFDGDRIGVWGSDHGATVAALLAVTPDQAMLNGLGGEFAKDLARCGRFVFSGAPRTGGMRSCMGTRP